MPEQTACPKEPLDLSIIIEIEPLAVVAAEGGSQ
jgi:hypothetical protein